jgi:hypothetical protein
MPAFDNSLMLRTTGNLTTAESVGPVTLYGGTPVGGLAVRVSVPTAYAALDTMLAKVYASVDGSTYNLIAQYAGGSVSGFASGKDLIIPFSLPPDKWYVKLELTVTSTTAANINFGAVKAGIVEGVNGDFTRAVDFH